MQFILPMMRRYASHVPIEMLCGIVVSVVLCAWAGWRLLYSPDTAITLEKTQFIFWYTAAVIGLFGLLTACSVHRVWLCRFPRSMYIAIRCVVFASYIGIFISLYTHLAVQTFSLVSAERVAKVSVWFVQLDISWGVYTWLQPIIEFFLRHSFWYSVVSVAYSSTILVVFLVVCILPFFSYKITRQYYMALMISTLLSIPLWLLGPALAPHQLAVTPSLQETSMQAEVTASTQPVLALHQQYEETQWGSDVSALSEYWEGVHTEGFGYAISSNPSMHVIWGVLLTVFLWRAHWALGAAGLIFAVEETIGTLLFLQHYVIDLPVGFFVALLTLWVTKKLYVFERRHMCVDSRFWFLPVVHGTAARIWLRKKRQQFISVL